jgi:hypothetical protein
VDLEGFRKFEFVCDWGYFLDDGKGAQEPMLEFLGGACSLGCYIDVI